METLIRVQARVDPKLHKEFKLACIKNNEDMSTVMSQFIGKYVELSKKKETSK